MCISTSFWVPSAPKPAHPKAGRTNFFSRFLFFLNFFQWFHAWNHCKTTENEQKMYFFSSFCLLLKAGRHEKLIDSLRGYLEIILFRLIFYFSRFQLVFGWFHSKKFKIDEKRLKLMINYFSFFKKNKKGWKLLKKVVQPAVGCEQHLKADRNTQQLTVVICI